MQFNLSKMNVLSLYQDILAWLRIIPFAKKENRRTQRLSKAFAVFVVLFEMLLMTSSAHYLCKNLFKTTGDDLGVTLYAVAQLAAWGCTFYTLIVAYTVRNKLRSIFDKIQEIYGG